MKLRLIGDVHGKYEQYFNLIHNCERSVQVGDMGFDYSPLNSIDPFQHRFIPGNHENYNTIKECPHSLGDYGLLEFNGIKIGFIRGAWSIDWKCRTEGLDWFKEEELSYNKLANAIDLLEIIKPDIMITHTCPEMVKLDLLKTVPTLSGGQNFNTLTENALQALYNKVKPKLWVFGHWHNWYLKYFEYDNKKTKFICIPELHYIDLDLDNKESYGIL